VVWELHRLAKWRIWISGKEMVSVSSRKLAMRIKKLVDDHESAATL
jgi:hypothetical protein